LLELVELESRAVGDEVAIADELRRVEAIAVAELQQAAVGARGVGVLLVEAGRDGVAPVVGAEGLDARTELLADVVGDRESV